MSIEDCTSAIETEGALRMCFFRAMDRAGLTDDQAIYEVRRVYYGHERAMRMFREDGVAFRDEDVPDRSEVRDAVIALRAWVAFRKADDYLNALEYRRIVNIPDGWVP